MPLEITPFGWEVFAQDDREWLRRSNGHLVAQFQVDGGARSWCIFDTANNDRVLIGGDAVVSIFKMCRVLESMLGILCRGTEEVPTQQ